jgi:serine/threonine protein kinase
VEQKKEDLLLRRLTVMFDMAGAFSYMHQHNIVYRDAKPQNAGIDVRGDVKIFDFGLAKELTSDVEMEDGTYNVTGETGSLRYMAPEVYLWKPYNVSADVHSLAIIFWEMMSLKTPFNGLIKRDFELEVVQMNVRPTIKNSWPPAIKSLIKKSWSSKPTHRPTMSEICAIIRKMIVGIKGDDAKGLEHVSRRSTHILDVKKTQNGLLSKSTIMGLSESVKLDFEGGLDEIEESDEEGSK